MIEVTKEKIHQQFLRETELSYQLGREKAQGRNKSLTKSGNKSQSAAGIALRKEYISDITQMMTEDLIDYVRLEKYESAQFYDFMLSPGVLDYVRLEELANIGLSILLDTVARKVLKLYKLTTIQINIGEIVEHQARLVKAQQTNPKFVDMLVDRVFKVQRKSQESKIQTSELELDMLALEDARVDWEPWTHERKAIFGSWILMIITRCLNTIKPPEDEQIEDHDVLPWFKLTHQKGPGEKYSQRYIYLTNEGQEQMDKLDKMAEDVSYQRLTMIIPPVPWTQLPDGKIVGGYLDRGPGQTKNLIHGPQKLIETDPSQVALNFLNKVQAQPWRISKTMFRIISYFHKQNLEFGPFAGYNKKTAIVPYLDDAVQELPTNDPRRIEQQRAIWKAIAKQKELRAKAMSPAQVLVMAEENLEREAFWIPWFFDTRLRAYPLVTLLSPQGADYQKALLEFADGAEVTPENEEESRRVMQIALATTWGNKKDKLSFEGRIAFAQEHLEKHLAEICDDPIGTYQIWSEADEPFQHLSLLLEYNRVFVQRTSTICRVPIGYDATCSGLQLLGSFVKDAETCRLVNVTPSDKPQDAYAAVAEKARWLLSSPDNWKVLKGMEEVEEHGIPIDKIDRKVAKKVVMLIPYGGTYDTLKGHVDEAVKPWNLELKQVHWLTKALIRGMDLAVPGFFALNEWFRLAGKEVMESGKETVKWRTATGSVIHQHYREPLTEQAGTFLVNKATYTVKQVKTRKKKKRVWDSNTIVDIKQPVLHEDRLDHPKIFKGWGDVIKRKNQTALAANWTHSQDAATLQLAFAEFTQPFTTVHDCVYAPAPVINAAVQCVKEAFVSVVTWPALEEFKALNELSCELPEKGTADVSTALYSDYLFS